MANTFSDSPHKAAVFKSADKVHSNVLKVLQRATHTTQCLYERWPVLWRAARWMGLYVWRGRICGLSPENGVQLACAVVALKTQGCPGALDHTVPGTGCEAASTAGRDWAALSILYCCLILYGTLQSITAAPLFKRDVHKFLWLLLLSLLC